jgi:hypothetical protein
MDMRPLEYIVIAIVVAAACLYIIEQPWLDCVEPLTWVSHYGAVCMPGLRKARR